MSPLVLAGAAIVILLGLTWRAAEAGLGGLVTRYAGSTNNLAAATAAVGYNPRYAEAHYVRATILESTDLAAAAAEHGEAVKHRPEDYALWLSLARARELNGEPLAALAAAQQAIPLAPFYSQPHYQLGNILLRSGRINEGFAELRLAAASDPTLLAGIIDLAWRVSKGDVQFMKQAIAPTTPDARLALAWYFATHQQVDAAVEMYAAAGEAGKTERQYYVGQLIAANRFKDAAKLWRSDHSESISSGEIRDAGFEKESDLREPGFSWRAGEATEGVRYSLDPQDAAEGRSSLKIEFTGTSNPALPVISQFVLVEPSSKYELKFSVRTESLLSGGLPHVLIFQANPRTMLSQSPEFSRTSDGWREHSLEFTTGEQTEAIEIVLQRQSCATDPCPIFGRLWLDKFSLRKL